MVSCLRGIHLACCVVDEFCLSASSSLVSSAAAEEEEEVEENPRANGAVARGHALRVAAEQHHRLESAGAGAAGRNLCISLVCLCCGSPPLCGASNVVFCLTRRR